MRTGCILLACVVFGTVASCFSPCIAETLPLNSGPIQAELVGKIDAGRAKIGDADQLAVLSGDQISLYSLTAQ